MAIGDEIAVWARSRPIWQQRILQVLAEGRPITDAEFAEAIEALLSPPDSPSAVKPLDLALATNDEVTVSLTALRSCKGVNALTDEQELDFGANGLTIVYGDNGSGKTGYARLIKDAVGARHPAEILPDVFKDRSDEPSAVVHYMADDEAKEHKVPGPAEPQVRQMHFYDEHCGDAYLARKSIVTYRPSALVLLDGLIDVCDRIRNALADRLRDNHLRKIDLQLPTGTQASAFVGSINADTTIEAIQSVTALDPELTPKRASATSEVARLESTNAALERNRLDGIARAAGAVASSLTEVVNELGDDAIVNAGAILKRARDLREAAVTAASGDFSEELPGVGAASWRALWEAARLYSTSDAYPGQGFPVIHDAARCPLCQQELDQNAQSRLDRFDRHMRDTTERDATAAEDAVRVLMHRVRALAIGSPPGSLDLETTDSGTPSLSARVQLAYERARATREAVLSWLTGEAVQPPGFSAAAVIADLEGLAARAAKNAAAVDVQAFEASLERARSVARDLDASVTLSQSRLALNGEVERLRERRILEAAQGQVVTTAITAKSTQLTKKYAGDVIKDAFVRETERLRLRRVTIRDLGGNKGQLEQQPGLLGAKAQGVRAAQVLSEGEQTAMGLAGFFTEAAFDATKSGLILDDPVTSLDHVRRKYVASRLAELAQDRQVVVFTHDVTFAGELQKQAGNFEVAITARSIERKGEVPGFVRLSFPWKAKDFGARLAQIEQELGRLTKERADLGQDDWDKAVGAWAGDLSELWESCVNTEILDEVFDRGTAEVRVLKFRILAAVTQEDDKDFQAGYGACSTWARRHNKAQETNYVPPEPDEMKMEFDRIRAWQKRIKKYRS